MEINMIEKFLQNVKNKRPLVHNITNYVAAANCADITLTIGASPIMADDPLEASQVTEIADGLVINTGTISERRLEAILVSGKTAKKKSIPVVLDPVGAGVSVMRTNAVNAVTEQIKPDIIRLNISELKSICLNSKNIFGVDSACGENAEGVIILAKRLAGISGAVVGVSGAEDVVTDGEKTAVIKGGHEMMRKITGAGCMLSSVVGAFAAANSAELFEAVISAFAIYGSCGEKAYRDGIGTASYKLNFFDEMTNPDTEGIEIEYR